MSYVAWLDHSAEDERSNLGKHQLNQWIPAGAIRFVLTCPKKRALKLAATDGFVSLKWDCAAKKDEVRYSNDLWRSWTRLVADDVLERPRAAEARKQLEAFKP